MQWLILNENISQKFALSALFLGQKIWQKLGVFTK
jgi:hypothetical protein